MSRELRTNFQGAGASLYAVIRKTSDDSVWNGTAFETWADANIATYDIALTDRGGDVYDADFPVTIAAGDYSVDYYERAGATPATDDLRLGGTQLHWDGQSATSASSTTLASTALTTLDDAKLYLRVTGTDDDTLITQLINSVSAEIERVCGVQFAARDRRERLNCDGQRRITLKQWPVINITRMSWGWQPALTVTYGGNDIRAQVGVSDLDCTVSSTSTAGTIATTKMLFADYPTAQLLADHINGLSGWTATVNVNVVSADLNPLGGADAKSRSVILSYPDRADIAYSVDYPAGIIQLVGWPLGGGVMMPLYGRNSGYEFDVVAPTGHQYILVEYRAGYETIPADVSLACNRLVADAFYETFAPRNVTTASLGPFTWKASNAVVETIEQELAHYIDVSRCIGGI
jgi:hypothetical protein